MNAQPHYPWQEAHWAYCEQRARTGTLPHALLIRGQRGLGKLDFAHRFAAWLLCDRPGEAACGSCHGCRMFLAGNHPDYLETAIEEDSHQIKIEQIRALNYFIGLSRHCGHHKIALIADPHTMNRNAANSLLKTLEEPPPFSLLLLVSSRPALLPATIVSRCQHITFSIPPTDAALTWLKRQAPDADTLLALARGAPLAALELSHGHLLETRRKAFRDFARVAAALESPIIAAERWHQHMPDPLTGWLLSWLTDIAKLRSNDTFNRLNNPDIDQDLRVLTERIDFGCLFALYDKALQVRRLQQGSLNQQLMLEEILYAWAGAFGNSR